MNPPRARRVQELEIERMLECRSVDELDASLLELAYRARLAPSIALWRRIGPGTFAEGWIAIRGRGPSELQPPDTMVRAVLDGGLDERLPGGAIVVSACAGPRSVALVFGGGRWSDDDALIGSALLALHACLAGPTLGAAEFGSLLPRRDDALDDSTSRELRGDANAGDASADGAREAPRN